MRIGFVTDMASVYADLDGPAGAEVISWAVQDFGGRVLGRPIELLSADHQNKADIAAAKAREWMDQQNLAMLVAGSNSSAALAMARIAAEKKRPYFAVGPGSARLTNEECTPYTLHYAFDTVSSAKVVGQSLIKAGYKTFYFITADYAFGLSLENDTSAVIKANGGQVVGSVRHPLNAPDVSSYLVQAKASKAQVLVLANAGGDFTNSMKAAREFGVTPPMKPAGLVVYLNDIHALGQAATEGLQFVDHWYWKQDEASEKFARRFFEKYRRMPSSLQAADYSAVTNYLKAVQQAGTTDGDKVMATLRTMKFDDFYHKAYLRADGRVIHDMTLYEVKPAKDTKEPWDYLKPVARVPGEQAFTSPADSKCPLMKKIIRTRPTSPPPRRANGWTSRTSPCWCPDRTRAPRWRWRASPPRRSGRNSPSAPARRG